MAKTSLESNEIGLKIGETILTVNSNQNSVIVRKNNHNDNYTISFQFEIPTMIEHIGSPSTKNENLLEGPKDLPVGNDYWCAGNGSQLFRANPSSFYCYFDGNDLNVGLSLKVGGEKGNHG